MIRIQNQHFIVYIDHTIEYIIIKNLRANHFIYFLPLSYPFTVFEIDGAGNYSLLCKKYASLTVSPLDSTRKPVQRDQSSRGFLAEPAR